MPLQDPTISLTRLCGCTLMVVGLVLTVVDVWAQHDVGAFGVIVAGFGALLKVRDWLCVIKCGEAKAFDVGRQVGRAEALAEHVPSLRSVN